MDISKAIEPKSDQLNASDLILGPQTFTISEVKEGSDEQPVNIHLVELPKRPYRPSKTMLRVLASQWGRTTGDWAGRGLTLFRNPAVKWAGKEIGGVEVSHMSHIPKKFTIVLPVSKGATGSYTVQPLPSAAPAPARDWLAEAGKLSDVAALRALWKEAKAGGADPSTLAKIQALATPAAPAPDES